MFKIVLLIILTTLNLQISYANRCLNDLTKNNKTYVGFQKIKNDDNNVVFKSDNHHQNICVFDRIAVEWYVPFYLFRKYCDIDSK